MREWAILCVMGSAVLSASSIAEGALSVTISNEAEALVAELIGTTTELSPGTAVFNGGIDAAGFFAGGSISGLGIESGVILTTGSAALASGSNWYHSSSRVQGLPGDAALSTLVGGEATYDLAALEFDFVTDGGSLLIRYLFASEEYNEFVNSGHNDVVGIFLDGTNIALVPGTSTPVSVDTVNGGGPLLGANPSYPELFHNNSLQSGGPFFDLAYDGFTEVFVTVTLELAPGSYHLRLAIADVGDAYGDSALLIEPFTFVQTPVSPDASSAPVSLPTPGALVMAVLGSFLIQRGHRTDHRRR